MAEQLPVQELDPAELSRRLENIPGGDVVNPPVQQAVEEPPTWNEIKESDEYKALNFPEQVSLARQWGEETKAYAATLLDYSEEQGREIDDFVANEAVEVPSNVRRAAAVAGLVKGSASTLGALAGGAGGAFVGGPVGAVAGAVGGGIAAGEAAEAALQKFTPSVARAREFAPGYAKVGEYAPSVATGAVGVAQLARTGRTIFQELGAKKAAEELAKYGGTAGLVGGGVGTATRAVVGAEVSPATVAEDVLFGIAFSGLGANARVKGYTREQALNLNERVQAKRATPEEIRDWNAILAEAQAKQARGVEGAKITEATLGREAIVSKAELAGGVPTTIRPYYEPLPAPTSRQIVPVEAELPMKRAMPAMPEALPEAGVRGAVRGTQADTLAMQRRGITSEMQRSLLELDEPVPRTNVFTTESQGIRKDAIIPIETGAFELVKEGPTITPRRQLPTTERLELPEATSVRGQVEEQIELPNKVKVNIVAPDQKTANLVRKKIEKGRPQKTTIPRPMRETVDPKNDPVVGEDINGNPIQESEQGTFYTIENGRVRTGPAFSSATPAPTIPRPMGKPKEAGMLSLDPLVKGRDFVKKWATTEGNLPKEAFDILEAKDQRVQAMQKQIEFTLRDLTQASRLVNKSKQLTEDQKAIVDSYMRGESEVLADLPEPMRAPVQQMRRQIDNLSDRLVEAEVFTGEKAEIVQARKGEYLTRSYEKFDNPKFGYDLLKKRNPERLESAIRFLQSEIKASDPTLSDQAARQLAEGKAREISQAEDAFSFDSLVNASNLGKDLSITKKRKSIPEEVRFLMGEYEDPIINYTRTAIKMINLLQSQKTIVDLRNWGVQNKLFFDKPTGTASQIIAAEGSKTLEPLNGLYAEPELVEAIKDFDRVVKGGDLYRLFTTVNAWVKWGKTVGSVQAQFRNPISNVLIEIQNGNFAFTGARKSLQTVLSEFGVPGADTPEIRKYVTRATQLGIVDTTVLNEFYQTLKDAQNYKGTAMNFAEDLSGKGLGKAGKAAKGGINFLNKTYRSGDNLFKLIGWESEIKMLMRGRGISREEAEPIAAERVKNTRPTYSRVFRVIKKWRNQPLFGQFMSWPSEILRTTANSIRYAAQDARTPGMRKYGYMRLAGTVAAITAVGGLVRAFMWATDFNDRKVSAMRRFVAPYQRNAQLAPTGVNEDGSIGYVDISYTSPYEVFMEPIMAASTGRDPEQGILNATRQFLESYIGPSILANSVASAIYGRTPQNREIRNPQDPALDQAYDTIIYALRQNEPATLSQMRRIYYALTGKPDVTVSKYGRIYKPGEELAAVVGVRPQSINLSKALESKASRFNTNMSDVGRIFTETYGAVGTMDESKIREQYAKMENRRRILFDEANKDFHAAMLLGMTRGEAITAMRAGGMGTENAVAVANNRYKDYKISRALTRQMRKELEPEEMLKRQEIARELQMRQGE
jgi:hypothetical protein